MQPTCAILLSLHLRAHHHARRRSAPNAQNRSEEAARVDGTSRLRALRRVTLPLAWPGVVTALIFTFIAAWDEFVVALILTNSPSHQPLAVALDSYIGGYQINWGHLFAASAVATVPVIILLALIERKVVSGLTAGSIK
nr:carbohydrate ABC transporter permease [Actinospica acidithermotolerans]